MYLARSVDSLARTVSKPFPTNSIPLPLGSSSASNTRGRQAELRTTSCSRIGEWVVIKSVIWFCSNSILVTGTMCWFQIWHQKMCAAIRSIMNKINLKFWNFKADLRGGKKLKIMIVTKDLSLRRKMTKVSKTIFVEKYNIRFQIMN